ncbi:hypothetical protein BaRGS_00010338, partial [Batillaria attramentaria]
AVSRAVQVSKLPVRRPVDYENGRLMDTATPAGRGTNCAVHQYALWGGNQSRLAPLGESSPTGAVMGTLRYNIKRSLVFTVAQECRVTCEE